MSNAIVFSSIPEEHSSKIADFLNKEFDKFVECKLSTRRNETDKSFVYFLSVLSDNEEILYQFTINKETGNSLARKGSFKLDGFDWITSRKMKKKWFYFLSKIFG